MHYDTSIFRKKKTLCEIINFIFLLLQISSTNETTSPHFNTVTVTEKWKWLEPLIREMLKTMSGQWLLPGVNVWIRQLCRGCNGINNSRRKRKDRHSSSITYLQHPMTCLIQRQGFTIKVPFIVWLVGSESYIHYCSDYYWKTVVVFETWVFCENVLFLDYIFPLLVP